MSNTGLRQGKGTVGEYGDKNGSQIYTFLNFIHFSHYTFLYFDL